MTGAPLAPAERRLRLLLRGYAALFLVAAALYVTLPEQALRIANALSAALTPSLPPIPISVEKFWLALAFSMLVTIAALCWMAQKDIRANRGFVVPVLISKAASTACYVALFLLSARHAAYLFGAATDLVLLVAAAVVYRQAGR